jgi:hypothetical protein
MKVRILKAVAVLVGSAALISPIAATGYAVGTAGAVTVPVSPVGTYNVTVVGKINQVNMTIKSNGRFNIPGGPSGTWTETNNLLQLTGAVGGYSYVFVIHQKGVNLGSAAKPGTIKLNSKYWANWYGVPATPPAAA